MAFKFTTKVSLEQNLNIVYMTSCKNTNKLTNLDFLKTVSANATKPATNAQITTTTLTLDGDCSVSPSP